MWFCNHRGGTATNREQLFPGRENPPRQGEPPPQIRQSPEQITFPPGSVRVIPRSSYMVPMTLQDQGLHPLSISWELDTLRLGTRCPPRTIATPPGPWHRPRGKHTPALRYNERPVQHPLLECILVLLVWRPNSHCSKRDHLIFCIWHYGYNSHRKVHLSSFLMKDVLYFSIDVTDKNGSTSCICDILT